MFSSAAGNQAVREVISGGWCSLFSMRSTPSAGLLWFETGVGIRVGVVKRACVFALAVGFRLWPLILFYVEFGIRFLSVKTFIFKCPFCFRSFVQVHCFVLANLDFCSSGGKKKNVF